MTQLPEKAGPSGEVEAAAAILRSAPGPRRAAGERLLLTVPILDRMRSVEGWLTDAEADLLIASAAHTLASFSPSNGIVEVGSYCGRSTVVLASVIAVLAPLARLHAIDPHEGEVGAADAGPERTAPTFARFRENIERTGVSPFVITVRQYSYDVKWKDPIGLLVIDGLHDYENCARDFTHFEPWLVDGAHVAFHDYGSWPGVTAFVDRLLRTQSYRLVERAESMVVLRHALESP